MATEQKAEQLVPFSTRIKQSTKQELTNYCNETNQNIGEIVNTAIESLLHTELYQRMYKTAIKAKWEEINQKPVRK